MTTETQTYANERAWRDAVKRGSTRHLAGWRNITTSKTKLEVTWTNDVTRLPPPKEQLTERQSIEKLVKGRWDIV